MTQRIEAPAGGPQSPRPEDCWAPGSVSLPATGAGELTGLRLAVKDMFAIDGHVPSFGHPRWRETHAPATQTAPVLTRLLAAGASITGLTKLDQLAWSIVGNAGEGVPPLNPAYPERFTGGSSSGPASAVAAGLADAGIGTDTGGSVRAPAAACCIFGLRPTHGLLSALGVLPLAPSFDTVGILARELPVLARVLAVAAEPDAVPATGGTQAAGPATRRVVVPADLLAGVSAATAQAVRVAAAAIAAGSECELAEEELGGYFNDEAGELFARIQGREAWAAHGTWLAENVGALAPDVAARARRGEQFSAAPQAVRDADERAWHAYIGGLRECLPDDAVAVLPLMPELTPRRTASAEELQAFRVSAFRFTAPASLAGRPQLVIPVRRHGVGVGILGPAGGDAELVRLASGATAAWPA